MTQPRRPASRPARPGRGRPRDREADPAILKVALELFVERGFDGTSIDQIAKRAGVARVTVYRRWSSKEELLAQAIESARSILPEAPVWQTLDTLLPQPDPRLTEIGIAGIASPEFRTVLAQLIGSSTSHPELLETYWQTYIRPRREAFSAILERSKREGLLGEDVDIDVLLDMVFGALLYRTLIRPAPLDPAEIRHHVDAIVRHLNMLRPPPP